METTQVVGSAAEALGAALGGAVTESSGSADTHVLVTKVIKVGNEWKFNCYTSVRYCLFYGVICIYYPRNQ